MSTIDIYTSKELPTPDICALADGFRNALDDRLKSMHKESVGYIDLCSKLLQMVMTNGHNGNDGKSSSHLVWGWTQWSGLHITVHLKEHEGFDAAFDYLDMAAGETRRIHEKFGGPLEDDPEPTVYAELKRKSFTYKAHHYRFTIMVFAHYSSKTCELVEVGTEPKYDLICHGSTEAA